MNEINRIQFVYHPPTKHRRHYVNEEDVKVVFSRLPYEYWHRLREVHFSDRSYGARILGRVTYGRREIELCALPHRISLKWARGLGSPEEFGAVEGSQWPTLAVRRSQLYDTLLHEIGHLQIIYPKATTPWRKFANEPKAEEFAALWRKKLWSQPFDHVDPAHNPPGKEEIRSLKAGWIDSHLAYKKGHRMEQVGKLDKAREHYHRALAFYPNHTLALERLGILMYEEHKDDDDILNMAVSILQKALNFDPLLPDANQYIEKINKAKKP